MWFPVVPRGALVASAARDLLACLPGFSGCLFEGFRWRFWRHAVWGVVGGGGCKALGGESRIALLLFLFFSFFLSSWLNSLLVLWGEKEGLWSKGKFASGLALMVRVMILLFCY